LQKCTTALRILAYSVVAHATDEYCKTGESTAVEAMKHFAETFLHLPSQEDLQKQIEINTIRGFLGMFGSIDCMNWVWKNYPFAWQRQFQDKDGACSVLL
jgi:hypothetical protein